MLTRREQKRSTTTWVLCCSVARTFVSDPPTLDRPARRKCPKCGEKWLLATWVETTITGPGEHDFRHNSKRGRVEDTPANAAFLAAKCERCGVRRFSVEFGTGVIVAAECKCTDALNRAFSTV
jgi:hypothetical protein